MVVTMKRSDSLLPTQPRHDDITIRRRFREHASTHVVKQVYAVTHPGHTDYGAAHENYGDAEVVALGLAEGQARSVWYEEGSQSGKRTLVRSFRDSEVAATPTKPD
jgi:putative aminopeptidase FrvX